MTGSCKQNLVPYSLRFESAGDGFAGTWPTMTRQATFTYNQNLAILGVCLSTTLICDAGPAAGIYVALLLNQDSTTIAWAQDIGALVHHNAYRNTTSASNYYQPAQQTTMYFLPIEYGFYLPVGTPLSLYASTDGDAQSYVAALATVYTALAR